MLSVLMLAGQPILSYAQVGPFPRAERADNAMVVSAREEASRAGLAALQAGGNAVDAAVATAFALAVVHPMAGNLGGGGFMVIRFPDGEATSIDFRETAPAAAHRDLFLDSAGRVDTDLSRRGHLASGVPGTVAGLLLAHERYGALPREVVLRDAIMLAQEGFRISRTQADRLNRYRPDFSAFAGSRRYFTKGGGARVFQDGDLLVQRDLARVLQRIASDGHDGFYRGETARLIAAEMERGGGMISEEDLAAYRAIERPVLEGFYRGHRILTMGPPSSGGIALIQLLNAAEPHPIRQMGALSSATIHLAGEAMRRAYADRSRWLGDPDFVPVPTDRLVDRNYMAERMVTFHPNRTTASASISAGEAPVESSETTHLSVVDAEGVAVSLTTTLNAWYGSKVVVEGAGFFLNNEMDDFAAAPGVPNAEQIRSGDWNAIEPGKRMVSSMTPTIVEDPEGRLSLVLGTPGGATIITTVFQILTNVIDHGMNIQQAVSTGRFHHQWRPDTLFVEPRAIVEDVRMNLETRGWHVVERMGTTGRVHAIQVAWQRGDPDAAVSGSEVEGGIPYSNGTSSPSATSRVLLAGIDPRGEGAVAGE